jgi:hypothetical protein
MQIIASYKIYHEIHEIATFIFFKFILLVRIEPKRWILWKAFLILIY